MVLLAPTVLAQFSAAWSNLGAREQAHIAVDETTGLVHSVKTTAANVGNVTQVGDLLHGKEKVVFSDAGYTGAEKHTPVKRGCKWHIAAKRSKVKAIEDETLRALTEQIEHIKATIHAAVEHPFCVVKRQFGHVKSRYGVQVGSCPR